MPPARSCRLGRHRAALRLPPRPFPRSLSRPPLRGSRSAPGSWWPLAQSWPGRSGPSPRSARSLRSPSRSVRVFQLAARSCPPHGFAAASFHPCRSLPRPIGGVGSPRRRAALFVASRFPSRSCRRPAGALAALGGSGRAGFRIARSARGRSWLRYVSVLSGRACRRVRQARKKHPSVGGSAPVPPRGSRRPRSGGGLRSPRENRGPTGVAKQAPQAEKSPRQGASRKAARRDNPAKTSENRASRRLVERRYESDKSCTIKPIAPKADLLHNAARRKSSTPHGAAARHAAALNP